MWNISFINWGQISKLRMHVSQFYNLVFFFENLWWRTTFEEFPGLLALLKQLTSTTGREFFGVKQTNVENIARILGKFQVINSEDTSRKYF